MIYSWPNFTQHIFKWLISITKGSALSITRHCIFVRNIWQNYQNLYKTNNQEQTYFKVNSTEITAEQPVSQLSIKIDIKLDFDKLVSNLCSKASRLLNAIFRLQNCMNQQQKKTLIDSFVCSNYKVRLIFIAF